MDTVHCITLFYLCFYFSWGCFPLFCNFKFYLYLGVPCCAFTCPILGFMLLEVSSSITSFPIVTIITLLKLLDLFFTRHHLFPPFSDKRVFPHLVTMHPILESVLNICACVCKVCVCVCWQFAMWQLLVK